MIWWRQRWRLAVLCFLIVAVVAVWWLVWQEERGGVLTVSFLDVGQGDAILIDSPTGNQVLIDGGPNPGVLRPLGSVLPWYDRSLDVVLATHPDADHLGGLPAVLDRYEVGGVIDSGLAAETAIYQAFKRAIAVEAAPVLPARRGQVVKLGGGAVLEILFPFKDQSSVDSNDVSIVAKLSYGRRSFLFTADAPLKVERALVALNASALPADVLKLGHHGSRNSNTPEFIAAVSPAYAVVSAGASNRYGHPHAEVLAALAQQKIPVLATAERGTIVFQTDGENLWLK